MDETRDCFFDRHFFTNILIVQFAAEERTPDDKGNENQANIRHADPEELDIAHGRELFRCHGQTILQCCRIQVREDDVLCQEKARHRTEWIERLRKIQSADTRGFIAKREYKRITGRLEDRQAASQDEDRHEEQIIALQYGRWDIAESADHIESQADQDADSIRVPLDDKSCRQS